MKRMFLAATLLLLLLLIAGCNEQRPPINTSSSSLMESSQNENVSSEAQNPTAGMETAIEHCCAIYNADHVYYDMVVTHKALLIGEEQIVELYYISGFEQTRVIERDSIVRVENSRLDAFDMVNIYDKTNQCISIMVDPGKSDEIVVLLK